MNPTIPREASGIHLLGERDPRVIVPEEFEKSPDLLYHPAIKPFTYEQHSDMNIPDYFLEGRGAETLGEGFYTLSDKVEAEIRSRMAQGGGNTLPVLITLLPYQARMMDFRDKNDPVINGPVPQSMAQQWLSYFTDYFHSQNRDNLPWVIKEPEEKYFLYLKEIVRLPAIDLRIMLGTVPFPQSPNIPNPPWSKLFANFIIRGGMDGVIYNEPSVLNPAKTTPIFVFYSLAKIGTYESWKNTQGAASQRPS